MIRKHFELIPISGILHRNRPAQVSRDTVLMLGRLGFNRMSIGIQDFDPKVQTAVNRIQSYEETKEVIDAAREAKVQIRQRRFDLRPADFGKHQSHRYRFVARSRPRLALYHYAPTCRVFKPQRRIDTASVPTKKLDMLQYCVQT